ncbi:hypothetical protein CPB86DRAFT_510560 [Serendipita vermifera]|nr:hypothetical protein CPB86DRAFT_510560 [Serendipita vermifera]
MIQALAFLLVATTTASTAMPLFNFQRWNAPVDAEAPALVVKRADTPAQLAQGSNFYFQSLHLESACTPGQFACVGGNVATCSPEANWEISPCADGTQCYAVPDATFVSGVNVQCMTETDAQTAITEAGGNGNVSEYFDSPSDTPSETPTESPSSTDEQPTPTESQDPNATCIPDDESGDDQDGDDQDGSVETASTDIPEFTASLGEPVPTESADPNATCTEEPEEPVAATEEPSTETESASATSEAASVEPTESPSCTESYDAPSESAPASEETTSTEEPIQTESGSNSSDVPSPTTLTIAPDFTSAPVNPGSTPSSSSAVPEVNVVGNHQIPATPSQSPGVVKKRMEKKVKRS